MTSHNLTSFIASLQAYRSTIDSFNPWADFDQVYDNAETSPIIRSAHLKEYLFHRIDRAKYILVAEAVGFQGAKFSGIPLSSERILMGYHKEIEPTNILPNTMFQRTSKIQAAPSKQVQQKGYAEPTATIAWKLLQQLPVSPYDIIFWNIFPFHPFKPSAGQLTNRTPRVDELTLGLEYLNQLIALCPQEVKIIAIGAKSANTIGNGCARVAHPANGGATRFRSELPKYVSASVLRDNILLTGLLIQDTTGCLNATGLIP